MGKKSKKSKKHKKTKKSKKHYKEYSDTEENSSSQSDTSSNEWVEKGKATCEQKRPVHEDWMSQKSFGYTYTLEELKAKNVNQVEELKKADQRRMLQPGQSDRELNPYWKNGGTGLPEKKITSDRKSESSVLNADYLNGVLEQAKRQAEKENTSLESVVAARYGSLKTLMGMISLAEKKRKPSKTESSQIKTSQQFRKPFDQADECLHSSRRYDGVESQSVVGCSKESDASLSDIKEKLFTDEEINKLASKIVKAEIMGNKALVDELKEKLDSARERKQKSSPNDVKTIVLMKTNNMNYSQPVRIRKNSDEAGDKRKRKKFQTHVDGKRVKYFEDDDKYNLNEMFENEQMLSAADSNAEFIRLTAKGKSTDCDDFVDLFMDQGTSNRSKKSDTLQKTMNQNRNAEKALDNCLWCLTNNKLQKYLIISTKTKAYLSVPYFKSLSDGHCLISPIYHSTCSTLLDEDVWEEILDYCKRLTSIFSSEGQDVVFFETAMNFKHYPHMVIHCVPIPYHVGNLAPIYFKKAILECEKEWAQNKKLVDVNKFNVRRAIPKGLPYVFVHFGMDNGYVHLIEDEKDFPINFAQEVIGGLLDLDHRIWHKNITENFEAQCKKVNRFKKWWSESSA